MAQPGVLVPREYTQFRGVDFSNKEVNIVRSPDALNMWKDYRQLAKCIETRPSEEKILDTDNKVFGIFFYKVGLNVIEIYHIGTKLYRKQGNNLEEIHSGMNIQPSKTFVYNNILYIMDGLNYLEYNGETCKEVEGTIPTAYIGVRPDGGGSQYNDINLLSEYVYITGYGDNEAKDFVLPLTITGGIPEVYLIEERRYLEYMTDFTYANEYDANGSLRGVIHFVNSIPKPINDGQDNIKIKIRHIVEGNREKITKCQLMQIFDNRIFVSGNNDYPNVLFHSEGADPRYFSDTDYYNEGLDTAAVKGLVAGNGTLWVFKEPNNSNNTIYCHYPVELTLEDGRYEKRYASTNSSIATGCEAKAINFGDDIAFFSNRGMEAISTGDLESEQLIAHRSSMVDGKLLKENDYKNMLLEEWEGYLLVIIANRVYLADSREMYTNETHNEYEWFYWELEHEVTCTTVYNNVLYLGTDGGVYTLTNYNEDRTIDSYWSTPEDEFKAPQYQKTTNKKGCVSVLKGESVTLSVKTDNNNFEKIDTYKNTKDYVVSRIKRKKWRTIQLKYSSTKPFGLYSGTLEAYVGAYVKR